MPRADLKPMARVIINAPGSRHHGRHGRFGGLVSPDVCNVLVVKTAAEYAAELENSDKPTPTYLTVEVPIKQLEPA